MSDEQKISGRYRELPREEPPGALDDAILAASRRAVKGRNRWYVPLAAAAVVVLGVAVTMHVERERPAEEVVSSVEPKPFAVEPPPPPPLPSESRMRENVAKAERPAQRKEEAAQAPAAAPPEALAKRADEANAQLRQAEGARAQSEVMARAAVPAARLARATPEQWLLGIDDLKRQGKHDEAARELAEFRKRYPSYRIPEAMTEKFETR